MTQPVVDGDFSLSTDPFLPRVTTSSSLRLLRLHIFFGFCSCHTISAFVFQDPRLLVEEGQYHTDVGGIIKHFEIV